MIKKLAGKVPKNKKNSAPAELSTGFPEVADKKKDQTGSFLVADDQNQSYEDGVFDYIWSEIAVTTDSGTVLELATLDLVRAEFEAYCFQQRTGVNIMDEIKVPGKFPWNVIFANAGTSYGEAGFEKKVMSYLEKLLKQYQPKTAASTGEQLDPSFEKAAKVVLHKLLKNAGNKMKIDSLAALYAMANDEGTDEDNLDHVRKQIRAFISKYNDAFDISRGGLATVVRLQDEKGKATGEKPFALTESLGGSKEVQRYTKSVVALGFTSKRQFEQAKADGAVTLAQLKDWLTKHK